jgi:hypothetical protein
MPEIELNYSVEFATYSKFAFSNVPQGDGVRLFTLEHTIPFRWSPASSRFEFAGQGISESDFLALYDMTRGEFTPERFARLALNQLREISRSGTPAQKIWLRSFIQHWPSSLDKTALQRLSR